MTTKKSNNNITTDVNNMSKEQLLALKAKLENELRVVKGLLKDVSYEGFVSMATFADMLGIKLSSMRSRYMIYCLTYDIKFHKFDGDKGYYFTEADVDKVVEAVNEKREKAAAKKK